MKISMLFGSAFWVVSVSSAALTTTYLRNACYTAIVGKVAGDFSSHVLDCSSYLESCRPRSTVTTTITSAFTPAASRVDTTVTPAEKTDTTVLTPSPVATSVTVTPAPTTITVTVTPTPTTVTVTVTAGPPNKRDVVLSSCTLPGYAAVCADDASYATACANAGVTMATGSPNPSVVSSTVVVTAPASTYTNAVTASQHTTTVTVTAPQSTYTVTQTAGQPTLIATTTLAAQTSTRTVIPTACGNSGVQWAYYPESANADPAALKTAVPSENGTTDYTAMEGNGDNPRQRSFYYSTHLEPATHYWINHRAYFLAPETGTYTFTASNVDDGIFVWLGNVARSGWNTANSALEIRQGSGNPTKSFQQPLTAGVYYPFRVVYYQGGGYSTFQFSITGPSPANRVYISGDKKSANASSILQFSCDGAAPKFVPFGQET